MTKGVCKQLLPIYDKPMIYYPLSILMLAGIREILIISTPDDLPRFKRSLGDGSHLGMQFSYQIQPSPQGTAQAIHLGEDFIGNKPVALIFGDNFFLGPGIYKMLKEAVALEKGAVIFGFPVKDPQNYGVVEVDKGGRAISLTEKPEHPKSSFAVPGLYFYDSQVVSISRSIKPSQRGEYEITDVNRVYLSKDQLKVRILPNEVQWLDTGTHDSLLEASKKIQEIQNKQKRKFFCIEEIAFRMRFSERDQFERLASEVSGNGYQEYFQKILQEENPHRIEEIY